MKATLLKTSKVPSKFGGFFYYLFFKGEDGNSYRSCLYPSYGNYKRWEKFIGKENIKLDNLNLKGKLIDADSHPVEIVNQK